MMILNILIFFYLSNKFFDAKIKKEKHFTGLKNLFIKCSKKKSLTCLIKLNKIFPTNTINAKDAYSILLEFLRRKECISEICLSEFISKEKLEENIDWKEIEKIGKNLGLYWNYNSTTIDFGYQANPDEDNRKSYLLFSITYNQNNQNEIKSININYEFWDMKELESFSSEL